MTTDEKDKINQAVYRIRHYGYAQEADAVKYLLDSGQISVDTELDTKHGAFGVTGKFFTNITLDDSLFSQDSSLLIVPIIGHEYAHIVNESSSLVPGATLILHGLGWLFGIYDYEAYPDMIYDLMLEKGVEWEKNLMKSGQCD